MTDLELVDAQRLAEALERLEAGTDPDLDPREDPSLSALVALAAEIRDIAEIATDGQRYRSYRERSRDHVLRRIGREALPHETATVRTALVPAVVAEPRQQRIPFLRWSYLAPVASAAAAAVVVLAFIAAQPDAAGDPGGDTQASASRSAPDAAPTETVAQLAPPPGSGSLLEPNPPLPLELLPAAPAEGPITHGSIESELNRIDQLINTVAQQVTDGAPVDAQLLRSITESTATIADRIERQPDSVSRLHVITYIQSTANGRTVLATVSVDAETQDMLSAARRATQDGVMVASTYFQQQR